MRRGEKKLSSTALPTIKDCTSPQLECKTSNGVIVCLADYLVSSPDLSNLGAVSAASIH